MACGEAFDSVSRTCGPVSTPFFPCVGAGPRLSGTMTVTMLFPSAVQSTLVTSDASSGDFDICVDLPVDASATYTYEASSKLAMYAIWVPFGDQAGAASVAPLGVSIAFVALVR